MGYLFYFYSRDFCQVLRDVSLLVEISTVAED